MSIKQKGADQSWPQGSIWRPWDLHVHSPASFFWKGPRFSQSLSSLEDKRLVDEMILAMNAAEPAVFALMDYWTFDGWFALQKRLKDADAPKLEKTVFPGIELRVAAPTQFRLNLHAIFSDQIPDQHLKDFRSHLKLALIDQPLSEDALIRYARQANADKLQKHGYKKAELAKDEAKALEAGYDIAELTVESYKEALERVPDGQGLGFVPFTTNDGLGSVQWNEHYAYAMSLFKSSPIFEARDDATWNAFVGQTTPQNQKWIAAFQEALGKVPRLPVAGSDAHMFKGVKGDKDKRGYGDFPSGMVTWIKADPTWLGLKQAIKEPRRRCFIGEQPPKLKLVRENKTYYLKCVRIGKVPGSSLTDQWFDGASIPLNTDLIAVIGNKGSGKSALADVIALAGNSRDKDKFSFLRAERFRGKSGEPAKQFIGRLDWLAGEPSEINLSENPPAERVELVRYIPQGRFEELCNDHVSGKSGVFERELRMVVFDHLSDEQRLDALTFDQLIEEQEKIFRAQLIDARQRLGGINREIALIERELHPDIKANVADQLKLKQREREEIFALKPTQVAKPSDEPTAEQKTAAAKIAAAETELTKLASRSKEIDDAQRQNAAKKRAIKSAQDQLKLFETQLDTFKRNLTAELAKLGIAYDDIVRITIDRAKIEKAQEDAAVADETSSKVAADIAVQVAVQKTIVEQATSELNSPQQAFQAYQVARADWLKRLTEIDGSPTVPESRLGLQARLTLISQLPKRLQAKRDERVAVAAEILKILVAQRMAREQLFEPLQKAIATHPLIGTDYDLRFKAQLQTFADQVADPLFSIVKQNVRPIRGEDDSRNAIAERLSPYDMNKEGEALAFAGQVHELLHNAARLLRPDAADLAPILRKERSAEEAYDFIYGFEYLTPHYTLLFQNTPIEQLSPGQRGALLLIFYLLVDRGRNPIILDQPEENLDNETVVNLLVPVLTYAKSTRQIVMVTHNPNLAVVCDAEQIVMCRLDRKDGTKITYETGAIENPVLNACVVKVLEGTKPAFDNRGGKYH